MKKIFSTIMISTLILSLNSYSSTIENLIKKYGKHSIMEAIGPQVGKKFTIIIDETQKEVYAPNPEYINNVTLLIDINRAGMTINSVEETIKQKLKKTKQDQIQKENYDNEIKAWAHKQNMETQRQLDEKRQREIDDKKYLSGISKKEQQQFKDAYERGNTIRRKNLETEYIKLLAKTTQERSFIANQNPFIKNNKSQAESDLKQSLMQKYEPNYSLIELLLTAGMKAYDDLTLIPNTPVNISILKNLNAKHYPDFYLILMIYNKNIESFNKLK